MDQNLVTNLEKSLSEQGVTLVAVSKTKPVELIQDIYDLGIRAFGENRIQELVDKKDQLPQDIQWHMIGNLQSNKVKYIAPFVHLIHSVSSKKLVATIHKEGKKNNRRIPILLQLRIAQEDSKSGMTEDDLFSIINESQDGLYDYVEIKGLMGMATFTSDEEQIRKEFRLVTACRGRIQNEFPDFFRNEPILSFGMSGDYKIAIEEGSNMVRIGSLIFGARY